jgi:outer membrane murein-binding lipoprotein Lpp
LRGRLIFSSAVAFMLCTGCSEPNYRNDVTTNGQGQVEVHRMPKDSQPQMAAPAPQQAVTPAPAAPSGQTIDQQIADLESQVRALNARIDRLKLQKQATP